VPDDFLTLLLTFNVHDELLAVPLWTGLWGRRKHLTSRRRNVNAPHVLQPSGLVPPQNAGVYPPALRVLVAFMDVIDELRNEILGDLNVLLSKSGEATFNRIEQTSQILKKGEIGPREIAPLLE
jgi:hypothetical protein